MKQQTEIMLGVESLANNLLVCLSALLFITCPSYGNRLRDDVQITAPTSRRLIMVVQSRSSSEWWVEMARQLFRGV